MSIIQTVELKSKKGKQIYRGILLFLSLGACVQFLPLLWMFLGTFKTEMELTSAIPEIFPEAWSLDAYKEAFT